MHPKSESKKELKKLPRQYSTANKVGLAETDDDSLDSNEDAMITAFLAKQDGTACVGHISHEDIRYAWACETTRTIEVGISTTTKRRCLNGLTIPSNFHTAIMDSSADTCIIGKG